ncbi:MAG: VWA domain-containing protein [Acidobacteria bacterium]|nr:VWA domain-containing protein [Acidobacteriota bacterium]
MSRALLVAFASLAVVASAPATQDAPVFEVGLEIVNVTVTVKDQDGNLVSDLPVEDFVVTEDGREQTLELFAPASDPTEREELALNLGMLFDTSESMRENLELSQASAVRFLDSIPRARDLILIFFDRDIQISRYNSENQQGIFERILETEGQSYTALYDSIVAYLSRVIDTPGRKVAVIFSDGDDTISSVRPADVIHLVRSTNVTIYPVAFPAERGLGSQSAIRARAFLGELAKTSGGKVFRPGAYRELAGMYNEILDELGGQYVLGYVSDNPARDGKYRRLKVEIRRPGLRIRHRPGYNAPVEPPAE